MVLGKGSRVTIFPYGYPSDVDNWLKALFFPSEFYYYEEDDD